jgi:hypothetical protein
MNVFAEEIDKPVTLPVFNLPSVEDADAEETRAAAERFFKHRTIRAGAEAWQAASADKCHSFAAYVLIGNALLIGRDHAMKAVGVSIPHGRRYSLAFRQWMQGFGFGNMPDWQRKHIVMLVDNQQAIEAWREALPQRERDRLNNAQHLFRRWQASFKTDHGKPLAYVKRDAITAWRKFVSCVAMLPDNEAQAMWAMVHQTNRTVADAAAA